MSYQKKVYDYDEDGFATEFTLVEGVVEKFFPQSGRRYGFIKMENGASIFFHMHNARSMGPFGVNKTYWIPRFEDDFMQDPKEGDQVVFLTRQEKKGLAARDWSTLAQYEQAVQRCGEVIAREEVRLIQFPKYRCYPDEQNRLRWRQGHFEGTLYELNLVFPINQKAKVFERFEIEKADGWEPCEDPRTRQVKAV